MNTKPDDELLALWVEDELDPEAAAEVERWATDQPEWLEHRDLARRSRELLGGVLPAEELVPHGEFFNARIQRETSINADAPATRSANRWRWFVPMTAAASLTLGFWLGHRDPETIAAPSAELGTVLYTPENGIQAEQIVAEDATLILLAGVPPLPDSWELPETAAISSERRSMASTHSR